MASWGSYNFKTLPAREAAGKELAVSARVEDYPEEHGTYSTVIMRLTGNNVPKLRAILYCFDKELPELCPGDLITADVNMKPADNRYGKPYGKLNADNIYLECYLDGKIEVVGKSSSKFLYFPQTAAREVKKSALGVFSERAAPFMTALLTGDTGLLRGDPILYSQMAEAGILHTVAISGMHVAFLAGFVQMIFKRRKTASMVGIPLVIFFIPFAGASASVVRAACMQIMALAAPLLRRENDSITSLSLALAAMLMINPNAAASAGLQLSFLATMGILIISPRIYEPLAEKIRAKFLKSGKGIFSRAAGKALIAICAAFASSLGAISFSMPLSAFYFGYVSVIGIIVNVLVFWAVSICFALGYASCVFGMVWLPIGKLAGTLTGVFSGYIMEVVRMAAELPYGAVYTRESIFGYWIAISYAVFIACFALSRKRGFRPVIPTCLSISLLCCAVILTEARARHNYSSMTAVDVGQGQSIVIISGKATAVIDCGGNGKNVSAGDTVASYLLRNGHHTIDILALTHFDEDHVNGVTTLMGKINVKRLFIPDGSYGKTARSEILNMAERCGTQVYIIQRDADISAENLSIEAYSVISQDEYGLMFLGRIGNFEVFIPGDADINEEERFLKGHRLPDTEVFIAGHHGSKYSSGSEMLAALKAEYAVVSCGRNSYGHPSSEALGRFEAAGMQILRTDRMGNICFRIDGEEGQLD
ncbi:MAG: MBL fold metallo-hydrolase [Clostridiales bacterium]|nr:MBL fold metallo-hydrolase [Clostridiales bacterium]